MYLILWVCEDVVVLLSGHKYEVFQSLQSGLGL